MKSLSSTKNSISVKWSTSVGVIYYDLSLSLGDDIIKQQRIQYGSNKYEFFGLQPYETYDLQIRAFYTAAVYVDETTEIRTKSMPPILTVSDISDSSAEVSWTAVPGASRYVLLLSLENIVLEKKVLEASENSFQFTDLAQNTQYIIEVSGEFLDLGLILDKLSGKVC